MVTDESRYIKRKLYVLNYAKQVGDAKKACRYFGIARSTFYEWKNQYKNGGIEGLARFHWHLLDLGINHVYINPGSPKLNCKVERSHRTDEQEFYQFLEYTDDVNLNEQLEDWEKYYNLHRPHSTPKGFTLYKVLKAKLENRSVECQS